MVLNIRNVINNGCIASVPTLNTHNHLSFSVKRKVLSKIKCKILIPFNVILATRINRRVVVKNERKKRKMRRIYSEPAFEWNRTTLSSFAV